MDNLQKRNSTVKSGRISGMRRILILMLSLVLFAGAMTVPVSAAADGDGSRQFTILFTHDIHDYLEPTVSMVGGEACQHGGIARLKTLLDRERTSFGEGGCVYVDAGDFSQGTLTQATYVTEASQIRLLGRIGCAAACIGNHEWDLAGEGLASMMENALKSGDPLPALLCANIDFSGKTEVVTEEQKRVKNAFDAWEQAGYGSREAHYVTLENGLVIGFFGLSGIVSIEDSPTSGMVWVDYIEQARETVAAMRDQCDVLVCLSHSGTDGNGAGEDVDLAEECPEIDIIISGHSHSVYAEPLMVGTTLIGSSGEYLQNLGVIGGCVGADGSITYEDYHLDPIDDTVEEDPAIKADLEEVKRLVGEEYLSKYGIGRAYDDVIAHSSFDFIGLDEMYATHDEYPLGNLIADSYLYEARKNGVNDIDVALVGLGTVRDSISAGDVTLADAFGICSLGAGGDDTAGHPLLSAYISGEELELLVELDASLGPMVSSIKMSYAGLRYRFNESRVLLDRVTELKLVRPDGTEEEIEEDRLYKVCCNMYAANMLGMLNGLSRGILKIQPKREDGTIIDDSLYNYSLREADGREIKEWVAFADYLTSFEEGETGVSEIPQSYAQKEGRKVKYQESGFVIFENPGLTTICIVLLPSVLVFGAFAIIILTRKRRKKKRAARRARIAAKRAARAQKRAEQAAKKAGRTPASENVQDRTPEGTQETEPKDTPDTKDTPDRID